MKRCIYEIIEGQETKRLGGQKRIRTGNGAGKPTEVFVANSEKCCLITGQPGIGENMVPDVHSRAKALAKRIGEATQP